MQMDKAARLREEWAAKDGPPCEHPTLAKEYHLGADRRLGLHDLWGRLGPR